MFKGSFLKARGSASKSTSLSPGLTSSPEPSGLPLQPTQGGLTSSPEPAAGQPLQPSQGGSRSSAKSEAEHSPQPALRGLVMKMMWPIACWAACCFFATAVVYTCADIWKWKMLEFKSETAYAGVSVVFSLVLYGIVESIGQNYKLRYLGRYDKFTILMTKMLIDFVVHMGLIGNLTKFPSSNNGMWHDIAVSWGSGIICVTSTILGRLTIEDPVSGFKVLVAALQPLTLFLIIGQKLLAVYCMGGACAVFFLVVLLSVV